MSKFNLEELRRRNLEDNRAMLAKLNFEIKGSTKPIKKAYAPAPRPPPRQFYPRKAKSDRPVKYAGYPKHSSRSSFSSDSCSSSLSDSSNTSAASSRKLVVDFGFSRKDDTSDHSDTEFIMDGDSEYDSDTSGPHEIRERRHRGHSNKIAPEDITDVDIDMVAMSLSKKFYDPLNGTSCHQCRQKTIDQKTICRAEGCYGVRGQFCGGCLMIRYGEDAKLALRDPTWTCPPCRGICNCSFCRRKKGRACTGIMIHTARQQGYTDVHAFLQTL